MHGRAFAATGGTIEMIQLWVNLPAQHKLSPPRYQEILSSAIPAVSLGQDGSIARIIAGNYEGKTGPARTFTPVNVWDLRLKAGDETELKLPDGFTALLFVLKGSVSMNGPETVRTAELATFERVGERITLVPHEDTTLLAMSGEPIDEPVVGYGPFVMNTHEEIAQAMADYAAGRL
jgi:redox-sensitive bicupin YhaK (pirin superfamily)